MLAKALESEGWSVWWDPPGASISSTAVVSPPPSAAPWTAEPCVCVLPNNDPFSAALLRPPLSKLFSLTGRSVKEHNVMNLRPQ